MLKFWTLSSLQNVFLMLDYNILRTEAYLVEPEWRVRYKQSKVYNISYFIV